jgi:hypothetical protein
MKIPFACGIFLLSLILSGCLFGHSKEIKASETLLQAFDCKNIETQSIVSSPMNSYHHQILASTKQKVTEYIAHYKQGDILFELPLDQVIQQQYELYTAACENLGGLM